MEKHFSRRTRQRGGFMATAGAGLLESGFFGQAVPTTASPANIAAVQYVARRNPLMRSVLEKIATDTVDCSFTIRLRYGADNIELRESEKRAIGVVWPAFVREVLWHMQVVGLVVVAANTKTKMPRVVPLQYVVVRFSESATEGRTYWVEDPITAKRMPALVFVKHHPLVGTGELTSPAATVLGHVVRYERILANQDKADEYLTNPPWVFENDRNGAGRPTPQESDMFVDGEVLEQYEMWHQNVQNEVRTLMEESQRIASASYAAMISKSERAAPVPEGAKTPPWLNSFYVPINQHVVSGPAPHPNVHFTAELELIESKVLQAFCVPPATMATTHAMRYASQPEQAAQQWGTTVRTIQRELGELMAETYMFVSADIFAAYADAILDRVRAEQADTIEAVAKRVRLQQEAEMPPIGEPPAENDAGVLQMPETDESLLRAARILAVGDADIIAHLRANLSVVVEFHCRPTVRMEELKQLYEVGLISRDVYAERAADLMGMPISSFLIGVEAQEADARERKKLQDILMPPEEKAPTGAKKRPASS